MLQTHLVSLVDITQGNTSSNPLPAQLTKTLPSLFSQLPGVMRTANALSVLLERTHMLAHLPTQPTACAILLLALEAELGSSLPHAGALAQSLGARVGAGKGVVMQRYKQIYDLVEEWIREVPWLDAHERKRAKGKAGGGRSKVAKRVVVARGLKDVVQFQEEIWRKRVESAGRPLLELDVDEKDTGTDDWDGSQMSSTASQAPSGSGSSLDGTGPRKGKKAKTHHPKSIVDASHFLLDPLSTSALPSSAPLGSASSRCASPNTAGLGRPDLLTHLLTADASSLSHAFRAAPSRLQLLAVDRGGADESCIADDELFGEDELEGFMRAPEEVEAVRIAMGWDEDGDADVGKGSAKETKRGKKRRRDDANEGDEAGQGSTTGKGKERAVGSKRINMDALARLLDPEANPVAEHSELEDEYHAAEEFDEDDVDHEDEDFEEGEHGSVGAVGGTDDPLTARSAPDDGGEVVEEWRPLSPGGGGSAEDWYDF